jgi:hypothetical protein
VAFVEHDHMVEKVAATGSNPALRDTVLPRTSEAYPVVLTWRCFPPWIVNVCRIR